MGVAKLKKAELYYHKSVREEIAAVLQDSGVCQVIGDPERAARPAEIKVVDKAIEYKLGARGLRFIVETIMIDVMFDIPSEHKDKLRIQLENDESALDKLYDAYMEGVGPY